jgi:metal-responsive CopG/Arc/MetJ family transcriptional regulator
MSEEIDYKRPIGVSLPTSILELLDKKRGRVPRSAFILQILEDTLRRRKDIAA